MGDTAIGDYLILQAVRDSRGAATHSVLKAMVRKKKIVSDEPGVLINTGAGLHDVDQRQPDLPIIDAAHPIAAARGT